MLPPATSRELGSVAENSTFFVHSLAPNAHAGTWNYSNRSRNAPSWRTLPPGPHSVAFGLSMRAELVSERHLNDTYRLDVGYSKEARHPIYTISDSDIMMR